MGIEPKEPRQASSGQMLIARRVPGPLFRGTNSAILPKFRLACGRCPAASDNRTDVRTVPCFREELARRVPVTPGGRGARSSRAYEKASDHAAQPAAAARNIQR